MYFCSVQSLSEGSSQLKSDILTITYVLNAILNKARSKSRQLPGAKSVFIKGTGEIITMTTRHDDTNIKTGNCYCYYIITINIIPVPIKLTEQTSRSQQL